MPEIASLHTYPVKSCRGIALREAIVGEAGLDRDHLWMLVDDAGEFLTQRERPKLALVEPQLRFGTLRLRAPGMLPFEVPLDVIEDDPESERSVRVWNDTVRAVDEGDFAAAWFRELLGAPARLVKFHPDARRLCSIRRTGGREVAHRFADRYPYLVTSEASLADLNERLAAKGEAPVPMNRFRPNIVLGGVEAYAEDHIDTIIAGGLVLKAVKPCVRCEIPNTDQVTGAVGTEPMATLATYRADAAERGGVTFGQHFIVVEGAGTAVSVGQPVEVRYGT